MVVIIAESTVAAQVKESMASTDAGDNTLHTSTGEPSIVKSASVVATSKAATGTVLEVPITTLVLRVSAADLDPALPGRISETTSAPTNIVRTIIEMGYGSASTE